MESLSLNLILHPMSRWRTGLLLLIILTVAIVTRFVYIDYYCYHFDEAWNDELSTGRGSQHIRLANNQIHENIPKPTSLVGALPWWRIWTNMDHVIHPPIYIIVLRWWRDLFGESPTTSRACSAVLSVLAILVFFDVGRILHGTRVALWASLIMALAGGQIETAQEARPYALLILVSMGALDLLVRIEKFGPTPARTIGFGALVLGMVLTHYFAAPATLAIGLYVLLRLRGKARRDAIIAMVCAAIVYAIVWGPFFLGQRETMRQTADLWLREPVRGHLLRDIQRLAAIPLRYLIEPPAHAFPLGYGAAIGLILPFLLLRRRPDLLLWCLWLGGTTFFVAAMDMIRSTEHLGYLRYSILGSPALYMVLPAIFESFPRKVLRHVASAGVAIACLCALPEAWSQPKPEFRQLASYLDNNMQPDDVVVFYLSADGGAFASALYLDTACYSHARQWSYVDMTEPPSADLVDQLRHFHSIWFVMGSGDMTADRLIPGARVDGGQFFPHVCTCHRITPDPRNASTRPLVPPKELLELR